jgi:hypothetical protein
LRRTNLEAFVVGGDRVYHRWQAAPNGGTGWSGRVNFIDPRLVTVADLTPSAGEIAASSSQATNRTKTNVDHIGMANNDQTAITTPK